MDEREIRTKISDLKARQKIKREEVRQAKREEHKGIHSESKPLAAGRGKYSALDDNQIKSELKELQHQQRLDARYSRKMEKEERKPAKLESRDEHNRKMNNKEYPDTFGGKFKRFWRDLSTPPPDIAPRDTAGGKLREKLNLLKTGKMYSE